MGTKAAVDASIRQLEAEFRQKPIDFTVEISLQSRLSTLLKQELDPVMADVGETINSANSTLRPYVAAALDVDRVCRVREEINTEVLRGNLDIGVLRESSVTVEMDGTKRFRARQLDAAIEMKYIKNALHYGDYRLQRDGENRLDIDLRRLSNFGEGTEKYFLLFSNADLFCETDSADYTDVLGRLRAEYDDIQIHYQHIPV